MDRLQSMRAFVRVVDDGSFAAAARALDAAPAAVTRLVADLESHLGVRLLHRSTRRLALTEAGDDYLARARAILADIDDAEARASRASKQPSGRVRVLVSPSFSFHQLARQLPRFYERFPDIALDLANTGLLDMVDEGYDVSVLMARGELQHGEFVAHRLATSRVVLCAAPGYLARHGVPGEPAALAEHRALAVSSVGALRTLTLHRDDGTDSNADAGDGGSATHAPRSVLTAEHADTLLAAAVAGVGIVALPSFMLAEPLASGALRRVLPEWHLSTLTLHAAVPTRKFLPARVRAFTDFLIATFQADGDPWLAAPPPSGDRAGG